MTTPFYVAPEQVMKDRADYAHKGIARGRALVAVRFSDGVAIVAENPSETLRKVSEIYDRIAFAGVGKYNEFDQLRVAGIRAADLKGFQYSRDDVDARAARREARVRVDVREEVRERGRERRRVGEEGPVGAVDDELADAGERERRDREQQEQPGGGGEAHQAAPPRAGAPCFRGRPCT